MKKKSNLNFYFHISLWCLKRFYEGWSEMSLKLWQSLLQSWWNSVESVVLKVLWLLWRWLYHLKFYPGVISIGNPILLWVFLKMLTQGTRGTKRKHLDVLNLNCNFEYRKTLTTFLQSVLSVIRLTSDIYS